MKHIKILLAVLVGFGISSFVYELKQESNKPIKVYQEGSSFITVWENKGENDKPWENYQVQKEYEKNGEKKKSSSFNEKELRDLKKILDQAIIDLETK